MKDELFSLLKVLPAFVFDALSEYLAGGDDINEIRLRTNRPIALFAAGKTIEVRKILCEQEMQSVLMALCDGSLYSKYESIKDGYIPLADGVRAGVCGRAFCEGGVIKSVSDISSINIRIPSKIYGVADPLVERLARRNFGESVLIFAPPGGGKTTVLRDVARTASDKYKRKVALVDSRCELADSVLYGCKNLDILHGYPKDKGIEIATRTMSAELIICDEIGGYEEAQKLLSAQNSGVSVIASAHAGSVSTLLSRKNIALLHSEHLFDLYVGVKRKQGSNKCDFSFCSWEEITKARGGKEQH